MADNITTTTAAIIINAGSKEEKSDIYIILEAEKMSAQVVSKAEIEKQRDEVKRRLGEVTYPDDKVLLEWAKSNYPFFVDHSAEEAELARLEELLAKLV